MAPLLNLSGNTVWNIFWYWTNHCHSCWIIHHGAPNSATKFWQSSTHWDLRYLAIIAYVWFPNTFQWYFFLYNFLWNLSPETPQDHVEDRSTSVQEISWCCHTKAIAWTSVTKVLWRYIAPWVTRAANQPYPSVKHSGVCKEAIFLPPQIYPDLEVSRHGNTISNTNIWDSSNVYRLRRRWLVDMRCQRKDILRVKQSNMGVNKDCTHATVVLYFKSIISHICGAWHFVAHLSHFIRGEGGGGGVVVRLSILKRFKCTLILVLLRNIHLLLALTNIIFKRQWTNPQPYQRAK